MISAKRLIRNLSADIRSIDPEGKAIFKDVGDVLARGIWKEFLTLVEETPQWSGTTAASWNLSMKGDRSVRPQPKRTRATALQKGHQAAVRIATAYNFNKMAMDIATEYTHAAIVVENWAPGAGQAESGHVRPVNIPNGAFERFQVRVANATFETIRDRDLFK